MIRFHWTLKDRIRTRLSYVQGSDNIFKVVDGLIQGDTCWHLDCLATTWQLRRDCEMWSPVWGRVWVDDGSRHRQPSDNKGPDTLATGNNRADINISFSIVIKSIKSTFAIIQNTYCYVNIFGRRVWTPNSLLSILFTVYECLAKDGINLTCRVEYWTFEKMNCPFTLLIIYYWRTCW